MEEKMIITYDDFHQMEQPCSSNGSNQQQQQQQQYQDQPMHVDCDSYFMNLLGSALMNGSDDSNESPTTPPQAPSTDSSSQADDCRPPPPRVQIKRPARLLLWQFVLLQLLHGHSSISWVGDQWLRPGVFKFNDTNEAAREWGNHKANRNMSYEKMSRCIRDYYTRRANRYYGVMLPDARGEGHQRVHFAFNLQNPEVLNFIRSHRPDYYASLIKKGIVRSDP